MGVARSALRTCGFAVAGFSAACMLAVACFTAGASPDQAAYASETGAQSQAASSQQTQSGSYLYAVQDSKTDLWGFADVAGKRVIPCQSHRLEACQANRPNS